MRSLFAKIFLAFFLTVVLLGVLLELTTMRNELRRLDEVIRPLAERSAPGLARAFESGDAAGLRAELRQLPVEAVLVDGAGRPLTEVPATLKDAVAEVQRSAADVPDFLTAFGAGRDFAFQPVQGPSGRRYAMVFRLPHERWSAVLNTLDQHPAIRLTAVGLVAGIICLLLARHISRPLVHLRTVAAQMASGRLDARAGPALARRRDEIGALGRDFDAMADRLSALVESQRRLLADVSHELRSPLARLGVALGLARQHAAGRKMEATLAADLERIALEADRLDRLIGQTLTLARIDTGVEAGTPERIDLTTLVEQVAADGDYEARGTGRQVKLTAADQCTIVGLADLVRSAVENVVRNAIRFTGPGTSVDMDLHHIDGPRGPCVRLHVRDHGPGVPEAMLAEIFRPFLRADRAGQQAVGGSGLGLAITERVVRTHGGAVRAFNAPGGGLVVEIILPLGGDPDVARRQTS